MTDYTICLANYEPDADRFFAKCENHINNYIEICGVWTMSSYTEVQQD